MQDNVLETLLIVDYTVKIWTQIFWNFIVKFGPKAEMWNLLKIGRVKSGFLE
jgi:hypothetical protein